MKIAVIAKTRLPIAEPFHGGLEAFTHAICKAYLRLGHEITLYAHADSDSSLNIKSFYGDEYRGHNYFEIYENDEYLSILEDIGQNNYDVVHNNSTQELPIIWGVNAAVPVVTTLHTPPTSKLKAAVKICSGSENLHFVLPSKSFQTTWEPYLDNGCSVIYNGVDMDMWPLVRESRDYLFWFGRIVHAKGLDIVMDAAHEINMPLKFAGPMDDKQYFNEQINPRMTETDTYLGHLDHFDIQSYLKGAAAMPSAVRWNEPFGLTLIEGMSSGVPVAGFDRGAFAEIINKSSGVVAKQRNVTFLAKAILEALTFDSEEVRLQAEKFSLTTMAERYVNFFKDLI